MGGIFLQKIGLLLFNVMPLIIAAVCFFYVPIDTWNKASAGLVTMLSFVCGAILLRLMRTFPISDPDGFEDEMAIKALRSALRKTMRHLTIAVGLAALTGIILIFSPIFVDLSQEIAPRSGKKINSAILGFLAVFLMIRIVYAIRIDFSIINKQADAALRVFRARQAQLHSAERQRLDSQDFKFRDDASYPGR